MFVTGTFLIVYRYFVHFQVLADPKPPRGVRLRHSWPIISFRFSLMFLYIVYLYSYASSLLRGTPTRCCASTVFL